MKLQQRLKFCTFTCSLALLSACATTPTPPLPIPDYAKGYVPQKEIPERKARLLYELMDHSGYSSLLVRTAGAKPTKEMFSPELQKKMNRMQTRNYAKCIVSEVNKGPSYFSFISELDRSLTIKETNTLLTFFNSSAGIKIRTANTGGPVESFTAEEQIYMEDYKKLLNKQRYASKTFIQWIPFYSKQVKSYCVNWYKENIE